MAWKGEQLPSAILKKSDTPTDTFWPSVSNDVVFSNVENNLEKQITIYTYIIYDKEYKCFIGFESASGTASGISDSLVLGLDFKMQAIHPKKGIFRDLLAYLSD